MEVGKEAYQGMCSKRSRGRKSRGVLVRGPVLRKWDCWRGASRELSPKIVKNVLTGTEDRGSTGKDPDYRHLQGVALGRKGTGVEGDWRVSRLCLRTNFL